MIGQQLAHYRITAKLGEGGMGEVYLAEDTQLDRQVALKVLPEEVAADPDRLSRFEREAKTVAALNHPNIVTIYSVERDDGRHFLTMELIEGKTLDRRIPQGGLSLARLFELAIPMTDALAAAHAKGITHRDVKPANVMVTPEGRVKILDFGLAKLAESDAPDADTELLTQEGLVMGTVPYMSPEQVQGHPVDPRSDVFSLGIMLYEMATGSRPFQGDNAASVISAVLRDDPPPVTEIKAELPNHLGRVVQHCLHKDPDRRYQSALDVRNELEALQLEVTSDAAPPVASPERGSTPNRPLRRTLLPTLLGLAAAVPFMWWALRDDGRSPGASGDGEPGIDAPQRIVVLPFENLGSPDDEYFAVGMTEEITSRLALSDDLGVISRKSAATYAGSDKTIGEIGAELDVDYVLEGTIRWAKGGGGSSRVRISPQLVRVADDTQVWGEPLDREIEDVFRLQTEIAGRVAEALGTVISGEDAPPTDNVDAYQAYLRGRHLFESVTREDIERVIGAFGEAVALDPQFAEAWARLGATHAWFLHARWDVEGGHRQKADHAMERALALSPESPEVLLADAYRQYWAHRRYDRAFEQLDRAEARSGRTAESLFVRSLLLYRTGELARALELNQQARRLSPRDAIITLQHGFVLTFSRQFQEAINAYDQTLILRPGSTFAHWGKAYAYRMAGDLEAAGRVVRTLPADVDPETFGGQLFMQLYLERDFEAALDSLLQATGDWSFVSDVRLSNAYFEGLAQRALDRPGKAADAFRRAIANAQRMRTQVGEMDAAVAESVSYAGLGDSDRSAAAADAAVEALPEQGDAYFEALLLLYRAHAHALLSEAAACAATLDRALSSPLALTTVAELEIDPTFDAVRDTPIFRQTLAKHRARGH